MTCHNMICNNNNNNSNNSKTTTKSKPTPKQQQTLQQHVSQRWNVPVCVVCYYWQWTEAKFLPKSGHISLFWLISQFEKIDGIWVQHYLKMSKLYQSWLKQLNLSQKHDMTTFGNIIHQVCCILAFKNMVFFWKKNAAAQDFLFWKW